MPGPHASCRSSSGSWWHPVVEQASIRLTLAAEKEKGGKAPELFNVVEVETGERDPAFAIVCGVVVTVLALAFIAITAWIVLPMLSVTVGGGERRCGS